MRIAVLINDPDQADLVCEVMTAAGHHYQASTNVGELVDHMRRESVDLLVLDWQPSGLEMVRRVRADQPELPVLLLVGRANEDGLVAALAVGYSDYQVKPLRRGELALRVDILLRRAYPERLDDDIVRFGGYTFQIRNSQLSVEDKQVEVTQKEFALALLFFRNLGRPLSRAYIQENVWSREADLPSRTLDTHVSRVRNKLRLRPENGFRLAPVYSYGYRLEQLAV